MPLKVRCACGQVLKVPETRVGSRVRCPVCDHRLLIPAPAVTGAAAQPAKPEGKPDAGGDPSSNSPASEKPLPARDENNVASTRRSTQPTGGNGAANASERNVPSPGRKSRRKKKKSRGTPRAPETASGGSPTSKDRRNASVGESKQPKSTSTEEKSEVEKREPSPSETKLKSKDSPSKAAKSAAPPSRVNPLPARPHEDASSGRRPPPLRKPTITTESADVPGRTPPSLPKETLFAESPSPPDHEKGEDSRPEPVAKRTPPALPKEEKQREEREDKTEKSKSLFEAESPVEPPTSADAATSELVAEGKVDAEAAHREDVAPRPPENDDRPPDDAPTPKKLGVMHPVSKRSAVYWLAIGVLGLAAAGFSLAVADAVLDAQQLRPAGIASWALVLIVVGLIHAGYALYLFLLPDWSSVWVVSIVMLITATAYAMMLAVLALGGGNTPLATAVQLDEFPDQRPELVCLIMLSLSGLLSYLLGRASMRWRRSDQSLAPSTAGEASP